MIDEKRDFMMCRRDREISWNFCEIEEFLMLGELDRLRDV